MVWRRVADHERDAVRVRKEMEESDQRQEAQIEEIKGMFRRTSYACDGF